MGLLLAVPGEVLAADLAGNYRVDGRNPNGTKYRGELRIRPAGDAYLLHWEAGGSSSGVGVRMGDMLAVAIGGAECAVVGYKIAGEGGLEGLWAGPQGGAVGSESAAPGVGTTRGLAGDYVVNGRNQDGGRYKGALSVFPEDDHWRFSWRTGSNYEGYGIEDRGRIAVSWGAPTCGVVLYQIRGNGNLDGIWKYRGTAAGSEIASR